MLFLSVTRAFVLPMDESPKFLISIGRDADAVDIVQRIARCNGKTSTLTVADLHDAAIPYFRFDGDGDQVTTHFSTWCVLLASGKLGPRSLPVFRELVKQAFGNVDGQHVRALFSTPRLAYSTSLIIFICKHPD